MKLRSTKPLRAAKGLYIAVSAALCLMGLLLIIRSVVVVRVSVSE